GLKYKGKKFSVDTKSCNWFEKVVGLIFSRRESARALLLFDSKKPINYGIHSMFVFFPFVAVWLDDKNHVVDMKVVKPFRLSVHSKKPFYKLVEIPINKKYEDVVKKLLADAQG
ncbi:hypothetical protein GOV13_04705, partial [Candidatus Pacearchaeota archaeon]|nr:hypothetical protein [Candidatus Pacearchaeota archaeon]